MRCDKHYLEYEEDPCPICKDELDDKVINISFISFVSVIVLYGIYSLLRTAS